MMAGTRRIVLVCLLFLISAICTGAVDYVGSFNVKNYLPVLNVTPMSVTVNATDTVVLNATTFDFNGDIVTVFFPSPFDSGGTWVTGECDAGLYYVDIYAEDIQGGRSNNVTVIVRVLGEECAAAAGGTGGGGGASARCKSVWNCTEWSECYSNRQRIRECVDLAECRRPTAVPETIEPCVFVDLQEPLYEKEISTEPDKIFMIDHVGPQFIFKKGQNRISLFNVSNLLAEGYQLEVEGELINYDFASLASFLITGHMTASELQPLIFEIKPGEVELGARGSQRFYIEAGEDVPPGFYRGVITVKGKGRTETLPFELIIADKLPEYKLKEFWDSVKLPALVGLILASLGIFFWMRRKA